MSPSSAEQTLLRRARARGPDGRAAFDQLVLGHQEWLVRYLYYLLGDMGHADDVAQDVFLRAYQKLDGFRGDSSFKTWIRQMATRLAFNHKRDRQTRSGYEEAAERSRLAPVGLEAVEAREALLAVMGSLPYPYREILIMRHVEEMSVADIAAALGIGLSAAKMRLSRARDAFWEKHRDMVGHGQ
jgi:RNA polymerase sigma-70 factor (ECF subfamily)